VAPDFDGYSQHLTAQQRRKSPAKGKVRVNIPKVNGTAVNMNDSHIQIHNKYNTFMKQIYLMNFVLFTAFSINIQIKKITCLV
jgi:hypothetical protein